MTRRPVELVELANRGLAGARVERQACAADGGPTGGPDAGTGRRAGIAVAEACAGRRVAP